MDLCARGQGDDAGERQRGGGVGGGVMKGEKGGVEIYG